MEYRHVKEQKEENRSQTRGIRISFFLKKKKKKVKGFRNFPPEVFAFFMKWKKDHLIRVRQQGKKEKMEILRAKKLYQGNIIRP